MRAIPAQRLLAAHPATRAAVFSYGQTTSDDDDLGIDAIVVFSPSMFLPAVIARAEALAKFTFGSAEMLGVKRVVSDMSILGVEADVAGIDGSPQGVLRSLLMSYASEQLFGLTPNLTSKAADRSIGVDLSVIRAYYLGEGALALRGERSDLLVDDSTQYDWNQR